jgi:hypothetical protein
MSISLRGLFSFVLGGIILFVLFSMGLQDASVFTAESTLSLVMAVVGFMLIGIGISYLAKNTK